MTSRRQLLHERHGGAITLPTCACGRRLTLVHGVGSTELRCYGCGAVERRSIKLAPVPDSAPRLVLA